MFFSLRRPSRHSLTSAQGEQLLLEDPTFDHEYLPIQGYEPFTRLARDLIFGGPNPPVSTSQIASIQTVSGTGANHIGAHFLTHNLPKPADPQRTRKIWISSPTWANHHLIWDLVGKGGSGGSRIERSEYPYYHEPTRSLDFAGMIATLDAEAQAGDVVLLHACAHNPTGIDPTRNQWREIATLCERKALFPFFDSAYQGFASGDLDNDAWAIREFASRGMELCVAQSFSKNLGLYGQRVGAFHLVCRNEEAARKAGSQIIEVQRGEISMPPAYGKFFPSQVSIPAYTSSIYLGVRIAEKILSSAELSADWKQDLLTMSGRVKSMRHALYDELRHLGTPGTWEHILNQIGMFTYTGLTTPQIEFLSSEFHIYMLKSGRISISGCKFVEISPPQGCC